MLRVRLVAVVAVVAVAIGAGAVRVSAQTTMAPTAGPAIGPSTAPSVASTPSPAATASARARTLALDAQSLTARRTKTGYVLTGQALVNDACQAAGFERFPGNVFPPQFDLTQFRRPGTQDLFCIQRLTWVTAPPGVVASAAPPRYITVRTKKGSTRVTIR